MRKMREKRERRQIEGPSSWVMELQLHFTAIGCTLFAVAWVELGTRNLEMQLAAGKLKLLNYIIANPKSPHNHCNILFLI